VVGVCPDREHVHATPRKTVGTLATMTRRRRARARTSSIGSASNRVRPMTAALPNAGTGGDVQRLLLVRAVTTLPTTVHVTPVFGLNPVAKALATVPRGNEVG